MVRHGTLFDALPQVACVDSPLCFILPCRITRKEEPKSSDIHVFTTQFFSRIEADGPEAVSSWTEKKGVNIFEKKFIFVPVNKDIHWSLFVIVNPGMIGKIIDAEELNEEIERDDKNNTVKAGQPASVPFILFMDSLRAHNQKRLKKHIYAWLNLEAKRLGKFQGKHGVPFTPKRMSTLQPNGESHVSASQRLVCNRLIIYSHR